MIFWRTINLFEMDGRTDFVVCDEIDPRLFGQVLNIFISAVCFD